MDESEITYRVPVSDEWEKLKALRVRSVREHPVAFGKTLEEELQLSEEVWRGRMSQRQYIVAELRDAFVGMISMVQGGNPKSAHTMNLYSVYVTPECRGRGVGRGLLVRAIEESKMLPGIIKLNLNVAASQMEARSLYEKLGFERVGVLKKEIFLDGEYIDELVMELML